jgi:hypothetical protein
MEAMGGIFSQTSNSGSAEAGRPAITGWWWWWRRRRRRSEETRSEIHENGVVFVAPWIFKGVLRFFF